MVIPCLPLMYPVWYSLLQTTLPPTTLSLIRMCAGLLFPEGEIYLIFFEKSQQLIYFVGKISG